MDNKSKDTLPPFGSGFDPHSNPIDPNNPYSSPTADPIYHIPMPPHTPKPPSDDMKSSPPPNISGLPPILEINQNTKPTDQKDPPLFGFFLTNPVTYLKAFLSRLIKRQAITIKIPVLAIIVIMVGIGGFGIGFQSGITWALFKVFPNYSPILHRSISLQGTIQKSSTGYYLQQNNKNKTLWNLESGSANVNLADYEDIKVQIKGNLTSTPNLIEVAEVISYDKKSTPIPEVASPPPSITDIQTNTPTPTNLPKLYPSLTWEVTQNKTLTFTSGKRRIEQEGVYLESSQITYFPQDFISYYTSQLTSLGFKQTLNATDPDGTTITYSKDNLFMTFGIKNVIKGTGDNEKTVGYKAFLEHN